MTTFVLQFAGRVLSGIFYTVRSSDLLDVFELLLQFDATEQHPFLVYHAS